MSAVHARRALLAVIVGCLCAPVPAAASARHDRTEAEIIRTLNRVRAAHGVPHLHASRAIARAADAHSAQMARTRRAGHGDYGRRVRRHTSARRVGELIAWQRRCDAARIVAAWMRSGTHRRVVLSRSFRRVGVARRTSGGLCFVTADLATAR
jgi:uncharacterized protein YkwD